MILVTYFSTTFVSIHVSSLYQLNCFFIILKILLNLNNKLSFLINSSTYASKDSVGIRATSDTSDSLMFEHCLQAYSFNKIK